MGRERRTFWVSAKSPADLGKTFGADLSEAEVRYLDAGRMGELARRMSCGDAANSGLRFSKDQVAELGDFLNHLERSPLAAQ